MKGQLSKRFFAIVGMLAFFVACGGGQGFNPSFSGAGENSPQTDAIRAALSARFTPDVVDRLMPYATQSCGAPQPIPGTYSVFFGEGNVKAGTFVGASKSFWVYERIVPTTKPTPTPKPTASTGPTFSPRPGFKFYFYLGTYQLKKTGHGCAFLYTSLTTKPIPGLGYSGFGIGFPQYKSKAKYFTVTIVNQGPLAMVVAGLSAKGGRGTATLKNASGGGTFDSGTVTLTTRIKI